MIKIRKTLCGRQTGLPVHLGELFATRCPGREGQGHNGRGVQTRRARVYSNCCAQLIAVLPTQPPAVAAQCGHCAPAYPRKRRVAFIRYAGDEEDVSTLTVQAPPWLPTIRVRARMELITGVLNERRSGKNDMQVSDHQ